MRNIWSLRTWEQRQNLISFGRSTEPFCLLAMHFWSSIYWDEYALNQGLLLKVQWFFLSIWALFTLDFDVMRVTFSHFETFCNIKHEIRERITTTEKVKDFIHIASIDQSLNECFFFITRSPFNRNLSWFAGIKLIGWCFKLKLHNGCLDSTTVHVTKRAIRESTSHSILVHYVHTNTHEKGMDPSLSFIPQL